MRSSTKNKQEQKTLCCTYPYIQPYSLFGISVDLFRKQAQ